MQHHTRAASRSSSGLSEYLEREKCAYASGWYSPAWRAAALRTPLTIKVMSCDMDDAGNAQAQRMHMACSDGKMCGGLAIVDHSRVRTLGDSDWNSERSVSSWRAAVMMMVQKRNGDMSYTASAEDGGITTGKQG